MKLIKGNELTTDQRDEVLRAFVYRWTKENTERERAWRGIKGKPSIPLQTDGEWLADHAFWFINNGQRLSYRSRHAEPAYMAD